MNRRCQQARRALSVVFHFHYGDGYPDIWQWSAARSVFRSLCFWTGFGSFRCHAAGMHENRIREELSRAYIHAVASAAGFAAEAHRIDVDGIDLTICGSHRDGWMRSPRLDVQAKATSRDVLRPDGVHYPLRREYYDDLRLDRDTRAILVVLVMPRDAASWLGQSVDELILKRCAYWRSLRGLPALPLGRKGVTIVLPKRQVFGVNALHRLMWRKKTRIPRLP